LRHHRTFLLAYAGKLWWRRIEFIENEEWMSGDP
jgi:hypothetical protein